MSSQACAVFQSLNLLFVTLSPTLKENIFCHEAVISLFVLFTRYLGYWQLKYIVKSITFVVQPIIRAGN